MSKVIKMTLDELKTRCLNCTECELCKAEDSVMMTGKRQSEMEHMGAAPYD